MSKCPCNFCHLHVHSEYSLLDGANRIGDIAKRAAEMDMPAIALTDHGVLYGAIDHYEACLKEGVKPIIGNEVYVAPRKHTDKDSKIDTQKNTRHLTLWAKNLTGYKNLVKLTSKAHLDGFYYRPRVDHEMLAEYSEGLICGSACLGGEIPQFITSSKLNEATERAEMYRDMFGKENFFLELMDHDLHGQDEVNNRIIDISNKTGIPLIATNDAHYSRREDEQMHKILVSIGTNSTIDSASLHYGPNFYLKSAEEMYERFKHVPEALENTLRIADMVDLQLDLKSIHFPNFDVPPGHNLESYLRELCKQRFDKRYPPGSPRREEAKPRMAYELEIIISKGYAGYFLVVQDLINWSKDRGIMVGCRGSAAGCLVSYVLGITNLDPLPYGLLFERFLNPDRVSTPDIDIDFPDKRRDEVLQYVSNKYGKEKVAQIITFGTLAARAAVRDTARAMGLDLKIADQVAKLIPAVPGHPVSIKKATEEVRELGALYETDSTVRSLLDNATQIEGFTRHASRHACGVVIGKEALDELVPLEEKDGQIITQYHAKAVEKIGLVKMDFLGLQNNTVINDCVELIEKRHGTKIDLENIELDDKKVYDLLGRGDGVAVFQMEGVGMRNLLREMKPENLEHIIAQISLYRPGPMDEIPTYIRGRHGGKVVYPHPKLEPVLKDTYGMLLYQEQVMQAAQVLAGFTGGQAEWLMRAMSKKMGDKMAEMKPQFVDGCLNNGVDKRTAEDIFGRMEEFAKYAFNKCIFAQTKLRLPDGSKMTIARAFREQPEYLMAMWPDGEIRPHRVERIVQTGRKPLFKITTRKGRVVKATAEHRFLSTEGYKPVSELRVGMELMAEPWQLRNLSEAGREARRENMRRVNAHPARKEWARKASSRMTAYQAARPMEEKVAHMKRMHEVHPHLTRAGTAAMHDRLRWLMQNDAEWRDSHREASLLSVRACYDSGPGYGRCSIASNGMWCASTPERDMAEWLISQNIEFEMHKLLPNGRICDFYFAGIYWEMDGMDRVPEYFEAKYGELPFVVVTPEDFKFKVEHHLQLAHAQNGDEIVSIEPCDAGMTYDIEMAPDGPLNFIANGLVSHNSHAAYYALVSYWTAYLKVNYTAEFMSCKMTSLLEKKDKLLVVIDDCRKHGIEVLSPDINESNHAFTVTPDGSGIRFGLQAIKGIGEGPVNAICEARAEGGRFSSLFDFCERVSGRACGKSQLETLVRCGAFDTLHGNRQAMVEAIPGALEQGAKALADALSGQMNIFAEASAVGTPKSSGQLPDIPDADRDVRLLWEKEYLGMYISDHPLLPLREYLDARTVNLERIGEERNFSDGTPVTIGGLVTTVKKMTDKNGRTWAAFTLEDLTGSIEVLAFSKTFESCGHCVQEDAKLIVKGKLAADNRRGRMQQNEDDESAAEETITYKIMADNIDVIPADAADQNQRAPKFPRAEAAGGSTPAPSVNGNGNGNGAANGHISINRRSMPAMESSAPPQPSTPQANGASQAAPPAPSTPPAPRGVRGFAPPQTASHCVHLHIAEESANSDTIMKLWNICKSHPGQTEVWLHIDNGVETLQLKVSPAYFVVPTPEFCDQVLKILGEGRVLVPQ